MCWHWSCWWLPGRADAGPAEGYIGGVPRGFKTKLVSRGGARDPVPDPPPEVFRKVYYDSPAGKLAAYVSQVPDDGTKRPAIIWITGGDCNTIDDLWNPGPPENDQTASAYRKAGIIMMFPSLRGGNDNPGTKEGFLGEVDDVLAAADYLAASRRSIPSESTWAAIAPAAPSLFWSPSVRTGFALSFRSVR